MDGRYLNCKKTNAFNSCPFRWTRGEGRGNHKKKTTKDTKDTKDIMGEKKGNEKKDPAHFIRWARKEKNTLLISFAGQAKDARDTEENRG